MHVIYHLFVSVLVLWLYVTAVCILWDSMAHCIRLPMERFTQDTGINISSHSSQVKQFYIHTIVVLNTNKHTCSIIIMLYLLFFGIHVF